MTGNNISKTGGIQQTNQAGITSNPNGNELNLVRIDNASKVPQDSAWVGINNRIATAGYSAAPEGYEAPTQEFVDSLVNELSGQVALVTSPTADKGSIDAISTVSAHKANVPMKYVTAEGYVKYINPENFPEQGIRKDRFAAEPKYVLPNSDEYSKATAEVSNSFLATGGRDTTVGDFVNAIKKGNKVIVLNNENIDASIWDEAKERPNNASAYLKAVLSGEDLPLIPGKGFTQEFLTEYADDISKLVKVVDIEKNGSAQIAAKEAASFLTA